MSTRRMLGAEHVCTGREGHVSQQASGSEDVASPPQVGTHLLEVTLEPPACKAPLAKVGVPRGHRVSLVLPRLVPSQLRHWSVAAPCREPA